MTVERHNRPIAGTIGVIFGGLWAYIGAMALPGAWKAPTVVVAAFISLGMVIQLWARQTVGTTGSGIFRSLAYILAVVLEALAIFAASAILPAYGLKSYFLPAVGAIVGLHFIGLWKATLLTRFLVIAAGMCAISAIASLLPATGGGFDPRDAVTGFGDALVLWAIAGRPIDRAP